jgi:tetratricopeptide (TPR) repeat protein
MRFADPTESKVLAEELVALGEQAACGDTVAMGLMQEAQVERDMCHPEPALAAYERAALLFQQQGREERYAHALRHVADVQRQMLRLDESLKSYERAIALYRGLPHAKVGSVANALRGQALTLEGLGDAARAKEIWAEAMKLYSDCGVDAAVEECRGRLS